MPDTFSPSSDLVAALAVVVCREIYTLLGGAVGTWQAVYEVQDRLGISQPEVQEALRYARGKGWLLSTGVPRLCVMLLKPGCALFAEHPTQPKV